MDIQAAQARQGDELHFTGLATGSELPAKHPGCEADGALLADFAVIVAESTPAGEVEAALRSGAGPLATAVALFDVYRGSQIGEGRKSLAFRVTFTAPDRALTDAELVKVRGRIEKILKQRVNGTLRT